MPGPDEFLRACSGPCCPSGLQNLPLQAQPNLEAAQEAVAVATAGVQNATSEQARTVEARDPSDTSVGDWRSEDSV